MRGRSPIVLELVPEPIHIAPGLRLISGLRRLLVAVAFCTAAGFAIIIIKLLAASRGWGLTLSVSQSATGLLGLDFGLVLAIDWEFPQWDDFCLTGCLVHL